MEDRRRVIWQGARPLIGTVVGVGVFGLPYVFSQAGYIFGLLELIVVAVLSLLTFYIYADLLAVNKEHVRFVAVIGHQLGPLGRWLATLAYVGSIWGGLLAYIIVGGGFVKDIFYPVFGGIAFHYQLLFWFAASACMIGGTLFVRRLQTVLIPVFFIMIVALTLFALPNLHVEYLTTTNVDNLFLPLGALLFAFSGFAAVPEAREALGRRQAMIRPAILVGTLLIAIVYALFPLAIIGMTGPFTSPQAIDGLRLVAGPVPTLFVSIIGTCTVFMAFLGLGTALLNTFIYDFRGRFLSSWWLTVAIPMCLFLFGARDFIHVIGVTGGLLGGLCGIVLLVAYERARLTAQLPKRALAIPQELVAVCFVVFVAMIILTMVQIA